MIRISDDPLNNHFNENTQLTYPWLNHVQDEICTPIEKTQPKLLSDLQLKDSIYYLMEDGGKYFGEISDYSGKPILIPEIHVEKEQILSLDLYYEALPKNNLLKILDEIPDEIKGLKEFSYNSFFEMEMNPLRLDEKTLLLSSNQLIEKFKVGDDFDCYRTSQLPEISGLSQSQINLFLQALNADFLIKNQTQLEMRQIHYSKGGFITDVPTQFYLDYSETLQELQTNRNLLQGSSEIESYDHLNRLLALYTMAPVKPLIPLILSSNNKGELYYFFPKMAYGEFLTVKFGIQILATPLNLKS